MASKLSSQACYLTETDLKQILKELNCILADLCTESNYAFLEHANIDPSKHLNSSKFHLNKVGDSVFENNLLHALNF